MHRSPNRRSQRTCHPYLLQRRRIRRASIQPESGASKPAASAQAAAGKVNINTATAQELSVKLSGIGDGLAQRIVSYREKHGPFRSVEAIKNVSGIGDKKFESIRNSITVG